MNSDSGLEPGETPIPFSALGDVPAHITQDITRIQGEQHAALSNLHSAISDAVAQVHSANETGRMGVQNAVVGAVGSIANQQEDSYAKVQRAVKSLAGSVSTAQDRAKSALLAAGVPMPYTTYDSMADLLDPTYTRTFMRLNGLRPADLNQTIEQAQASAANPTISAPVAISVGPPSLPICPDGGTDCGGSSTPIEGNPCADANGNAGVWVQQPGTDCMYCSTIEATIGQGSCAENVIVRVSPPLTPPPPPLVPPPTGLSPPPPTIPVSPTSPPPPTDGSCPPGTVPSDHYPFQINYTGNPPTANSFFFPYDSTGDDSPVGYCKIPFGNPPGQLSVAANVSANLCTAMGGDVLAPGLWQQGGYQTWLVVPYLPCSPTSPTSPPPPPESPPTSPPPPGACCPDTNVTVNVPPITVNYPPPPPPPPPPASPPAPPPCPDGYTWDTASNSCVAAVSPPPPDVTVDVEAGFPAGVGWGQTGDCAALASLLAGLAPPTTTGQESGRGQAAATLDPTLGLMIELLPGVIQWPIVAMLPSTGDNAQLSATRTFLAGMFSYGNSVLQQVAEQSPLANVPNPAAAITFGAAISIADFAAEWLGMPTDYLVTAVRYSYQAANPQYLPGQPEINALYLSHKIDESRWECYTKAQGNIPSTARMVRDAAQTRPNPNEVVDLYNRGSIEDEATFFMRMRQLGVIHERHSKEYHELSRQIPGMSDLVRFMTRDVADPAVVQKYGLDSEFKQKFAGKLQEWAKQQNVPYEFMLYAWRAHWEYPSPTEIYEFMRRLRPDRPEVAEWDNVAAQQGDQAATAEFGPRPPVFTEADARYLLSVQDKAPNTIDPLIAVAYRTMTLTDARTAYEMGYFNEDQLLQRILDAGFNRSDADVMLGFYRANANRLQAARSGAWSQAKIVASYSDGSLPPQESDRLLAVYVPDSHRRAQIFANADSQRTANTRKIVLAGLQKGYLYGQYDLNYVLDEMSKSGIHPPVSTAIADQWTAAKNGRHKEVRVGQLAQFWNNNLISNDEYLRRLLNLGYTNADASNIVAVQFLTKEAKVAKQLAAQQKANLLALQRQSAQQQKIALQKARQQQLAQQEAFKDQLDEQKLAEKASEFAVKQKEEAPAKADALIKTELQIDKLDVGLGLPEQFPGAH